MNKGGTYTVKDGVKVLVNCTQPAKNKNAKDKSIKKAEVKADVS